ncbi:MAG: hypothetical protein ACTS8S_07480, partial [Giesbergeria sp.]
LTFSHLLTIDAHPSLWMLALGVAPVTVVALLAAWHSRLRWFALPLLAVLALTVLVYLEELRNHVNWLYFMQHAGTMILLATTFGSTLGQGDANALCSRVTRVMLPGPPDAAYMRYTWKVTVAWTAYFVTSAAVSVGLFFFGPLSVWSYFANLLTPVVVGLMFVIEYGVRVRVLPDRAHFSIAQTIRAYRAYEQR